jgi:hypothetical protein
MNTSSLGLPKPTNRTVAGPKMRHDGKRLFVEDDDEQDDGKIVWSEVVVDEVLAFEYRQNVCCRAADFVEEQQEVRCLTQSSYLSETLKLWKEAVGCQEWRKIRAETIASSISQFSLTMQGV